MFDEIIVQFGLNKYLKNKQTFFETLNKVLFHYLNIPTRYDFEKSFYEKRAEGALGHVQK